MRGLEKYFLYVNIRTKQRAFTLIAIRDDPHWPSGENSLIKFTFPAGILNEYCCSFTNRENTLELIELSNKNLAI